MKKNYLLIFLIVVAHHSSAQYASQNISLLSIFDNPAVIAEPQVGLRYSSCVGWANAITGKEYGIIGSTSGTYIVDVTNPSNPVQRAFVSSRLTNMIWHEYKTYDKYLYVVADGQSNQLQIIDLSYLPDSVHVVYDSNALISAAHTIFVDDNKMYLAWVHSPTGTHNMQVYSLANPAAPVLLRSLDQDYPGITQVHDMFVTHDTVYASCASQGMYIFKFNSSTNRFSQIGSLTTYPEQGYNHSSVLSQYHSTMYMCDETTGKGIKVVDVTTISCPTVDSVFRSHAGAIAHNPYVKGNFLYIAYYLDGVYVYNISNPVVPVLAGYFDTHPQNATTFPPNTYQGCWAVYTGLPSGTLLASDMQLGLFCLDASAIVTSPTVLNLKTFIEGYYTGNGQLRPMLFENGLSTDPTACDSIVVELRDPAEPDNVVVSVKTLLHKNGTAQIVLANTVLHHAYFIVVRQRNAIETWSKNVVLFTSTVTSFDFTSP